MGCSKQALSSLITSSGNKLLALANDAVSKPDGVVVGLSDVVAVAPSVALAVVPVGLATVVSGAPPETAEVGVVVLMGVVVVVVLLLIVVMMMVLVVLIMVVAVLIVVVLMGMVVVLMVVMVVVLMGMVVVMLLGLVVTFADPAVVCKGDKVIFADVVFGCVVVVAATFGPSVTNCSAVQNSSSGRVAFFPL